MKNLSLLSYKNIMTVKKKKKEREKDGSGQISLEGKERNGNENKRMRKVISKVCQESDLTAFFFSSVFISLSFRRKRRREKIVETGSRKREEPDLDLSRTESLSPFFKY